VGKGSERDTNVCESPLVRSVFYLRLFFTATVHMYMLAAAAAACSTRTNTNTSRREAKHITLYLSHFLFVLKYLLPLGTYRHTYDARAQPPRP
jgi:hypothetical protein